jgi:hypothetical protein
MMQHVDEWLDTPSWKDEGVNYAKFVLDYKRMPAWKISAYGKWMAQFKLFCTYQDARYRCTGASRLGDVWLAKDFKRDTGYDMRVDVSQCSQWADKP